LEGATPLRGRELEAPGTLGRRKRS